MRENASAAPAPHQAAHEPVDTHERWPFAWSALLVVGASLMLWAALIGGAMALVRLFA